MMLGYPAPMKWKYDATKGLQIDLPDSLQAEERRPNEFAWGWSVQPG
jgi:hypothetical protein